MTSAFDQEFVCTRDRSHMMSATKRGGEVSRLLIFSDKAGRGIGQLLILADKGGEGLYIF